ncbi:hypothetical protein KDH_25300 [Dictyobacter sp. S3.2.2.5]|uniref:Uncharacterized protein n=1 Tax=Dictyobacter halimunensis TaxID=3026934 RepID=A0ABQ6FSB8_9CHLR|nr:hypothetical protein KDH_25300 [Dictyobacter sp. S3.2.2.5]
MDAVLPGVRYIFARPKPTMGVFVREEGKSGARPEPTIHVLYCKNVTDTHGVRAA